VVPEDAMDKMARKLSPPTVAEGFTRVTKLTPDPAPGARR